MHSNWDDLRYLLAVADAGSAAAAARALGVNHATVIRRIRAFEKAQNRRLFEHRGSGYRITPDGETFLEAARKIDATMLELERRTVGEQHELTGSVRITTADGMFPLLADAVVACRRRYPGLILDLVITNQALNLSALDADIALRPARDAPPDLVARRICDVAFAVYGAAPLCEAVVAPYDDGPWLGVNAPLDASAPGRWLRERVADERIVLRCGSFVNLLTLAERGLGFAVLPCYLGDASASLRRISASLEPRNRLWLLSHRDVIRSRRVLTCSEFFYRFLRGRRALLGGSGGR